jgi:Chalcone isomerase-like
MDCRFTLPRRLAEFVVCAALLFVAPTVRAAAGELDGVTMPDSQDVAGVHLVLNGMGLRTYSFLRIHIYVAGLYLRQRSTDPEVILEAIAPKQLRFIFQRDINAETARKSWQESLSVNCRSPCHLQSEMVDRFLAAVPAVQKGDIGILSFTSKGLDIFNNGQLLGEVFDPTFVRVILSTFVGMYPPTPALKRGLLGAPF